MRLFGKFIVGGIVAGAIVASTIHRRHLRTGEAYEVLLRRLPSDTLAWLQTTRTHAVEAIEDGLAAARERDAEIVRALDSAGG